jgi:ubiquinone/menaquinone biosynthesis C-methylase UbiE
MFKRLFSRVLSLQFTTIGLDVDKGLKEEIQGKFRKLNFILADMHAMPLRSHSVDIVVCASVLEHCQNLEDSVRKIKDVLKKDGIFIAGYPVETKFFKFIWKRVSPWSFRFIDQSQTYWCNPYTGKQECYWESPLTHKQDYKTIRNVLRRHFKILQKEKLPLNILPNSITYYECIKMRNEI